MLHTVVLAGLAGCSDTFRGSVARSDQMFEGVADRFAPNVYDARYNVARIRLAQSALVPSRVFNDSLVWESRASATARSIFIAGTFGPDGKYRLDTKPTPTPPTKPGDTRHLITLDQVSPNQFRWETKVDLALGSVTADEVAKAFDLLLAAPEDRTEKAVRDDYRAAFPRATAAFGRGFILDSVNVAPAALGATSVTLRFAFKPELMKASHPQLAQYLDKYLGPAKYHFALSDKAGAALFDIVGRDRAMTLRYRVKDGKLVNLLGPPRPWPDSITMTSDVSLKVKIFTVGFHELVTDFVVSNTGSGYSHDRAWAVVAQREPKWDLPLITERLIRSPLHRPFEGQGSMFRMSVRDSVNAQTTFTRRVRLDVQESAIMRFLGSLASHAIGDLDDRVEQEEHRFLRDGFLALQADLRAIR